MLNEQYTLTGKVVAEFTAKSALNDRVFKVIAYDNTDVYELIEFSDGELTHRLTQCDFESAVDTAIRFMNQYTYFEE